MEITVQCSSHSQSTLKHLCSQGKFTPRTTKDDTAMTVSMPMLHNKITVNNVEMKNKISFKVNVPHWMIVKEINALDTGLSAVIK